jgi:hypothetical protein
MIDAHTSDYEFHPMRVSYQDKTTRQHTVAWQYSLDVAYL